MATVLKKDTALELDMTEEDIYRIHKTITSEIAFYDVVLAKSRMKYGALPELEAKLANAELPEHPHWEESIEYRTAYEELENQKRKNENEEGGRKGEMAGSDYWYCNGCDYVGFGLCSDDTNGEC